jgi:hypothetical protein
MRVIVATFMGLLALVGRLGAGCAEPGQEELGPAWRRAVPRAGRPSLRGRLASELLARLAVGSLRSELALISTVGFRLPQWRGRYKPL